MLFGHPAPFDRHDWVVDRGGEEVRYVIDYYHNESGVASDQTPLHLLDSSSIKSIKVDVRPALDSADALLDRVMRMPYEQFKSNTEYNPPPFFPTNDMGTAPPFTKFKEPKKTVASTADALPPPVRSAEQINEILRKIESDCRLQKDALALCTGEEACGAAAVALQRCSAMMVCPTIVKDFDMLLKKMSEQKADDEDGVREEDLMRGYDAMTGCLENFAMACFSTTDEEAEVVKK